MKLDLPVHAYTGQRALGIVNGRPVWPIKGGSDDHTDDPPGDGQPGEGNEGDDGDSANPPPVPKPGDDYRSRFTAQRKVNRDLEAKLNAARDELKRVQDEKPQTPGDQPDLDAIKAQAIREANAAAAQRILRSEIKAAAAGKLADPADAYKFLDLADFEVNENGDVDTAEIASAITGLLTSKPYLKAAQSGHGSADGGVRKGSRPDQLTREQIQSMSSDAVEAARQKGQLNDLLGIK